ncbi:NAP1 [Symbiodinium pilosum]|uniref:NAP1 protein n=1 Tax=Symbiodinium pilosum TaxID=2952 RepID=A0A812WIZ6_SYMPI|nr:NAP1 [Symbiodinium pilosum]
MRKSMRKDGYAKKNDYPICRTGKPSKQMKVRFTDEEQQIVDPQIACDFLVDAIGPEAKTSPSDGDSPEAARFRRHSHLASPVAVQDDPKPWETVTIAGCAYAVLQLAYLGSLREMPILQGLDFLKEDPQLFDTFRTALSTSSRAGSRYRADSRHASVVPAIRRGSTQTDQDRTHLRLNHEFGLIALVFASFVSCLGTAAPVSYSPSVADQSTSDNRQPLDGADSSSAFIKSEYALRLGLQKLAAMQVCLQGPLAVREAALKRRLVLFAEAQGRRRAANLASAALQLWGQNVASRRLLAAQRDAAFYRERLREQHACARRKVPVAEGDHEGATRRWAFEASSYGWCIGCCLAHRPPEPMLAAALGSGAWAIGLEASLVRVCFHAWHNLKPLLAARERAAAALGRQRVRSCLIHALRSWAQLPRKRRESTLQEASAKARRQAVNILRLWKLEVEIASRSRELRFAERRAMARWGRALAAILSSRGRMLAQLCMMGWRLFHRASHLRREPAPPVKVGLAVRLDVTAETPKRQGMSKAGR